MFVNINHHHARITVISEHSAVLPHSVCLWLFACPCIVDSLQSREGNTSAESVSSDDYVAALSISRAFNIIFAVHNENINFVICNKAFRFADNNINRLFSSFLRRQGCIVLCNFCLKISIISFAPIKDFIYFFRKVLMCRYSYTWVYKTIADLAARCKYLCGNSNMTDNCFFRIFLYCFKECYAIGLLRGREEEIAAQIGTSRLKIVCKVWVPA